MEVKVCLKEALPRDERMILKMNNLTSEDQR
jgi:hypothetical protein